jgi:hypothetical protein
MTRRGIDISGRTWQGKLWPALRWEMTWADRAETAATSLRPERPASSSSRAIVGATPDVLRADRIFGLDLTFGMTAIRFDFAMRARYQPRIFARTPRAFMRTARCIRVLARSCRGRTLRWQPHGYPERTERVSSRAFCLATRRCGKVKVVHKANCPGAWRRDIADIDCEERHRPRSRYRRLSGRSQRSDDL